MAGMLRFGMSGLPPEGVDDAVFMDELVSRGHSAYELGFTKDFPWKEKRCVAFGKAAAERGIDLSLHAPYFATLTGADDEKAKAQLDRKTKAFKAIDADKSGELCLKEFTAGPQKQHKKKADGAKPKKDGAAKKEKKAAQP